MVAVTQSRDSPGRQMMWNVLIIAALLLGIAGCGSRGQPGTSVEGATGAKTEHTHAQHALGVSEEDEEYEEYGEAASASRSASPALDDRVPSLQIVEPLDGAVLSSGDLYLRVEVHGFILDSEAIGKPKVPGRGHWHIYLDGNWIGASGTSEYIVTDLTPGPHHIRVSLANNDHSPLSPPVEDSLVLDVH